MNAPEPPLDQGWYLMSVRDLEIELARLRDPGRKAERSGAIRLTNAEALAFRSAGNLPDEMDRTLRLVLFVDGEPLGEKRLRYEPDFHAAPSWRVAGSRPINVVPLLLDREQPAVPDVPWWEQPDVAPLEEEWQQNGTVGGIRVPAELRSFVLKTIVSLRDVGLDVTRRSILDSVARWLSPEQVDELRIAFENLDQE